MSERERERERSNILFGYFFSQCRFGKKKEKKKEKRGESVAYLPVGVEFCGFNLRNLE